MKAVSDYRQHAEECRKLARQMTIGEQREQLLKLAHHWDELARSREGQIRRHLGLGAIKPPPGEEAQYEDDQ
jgi:hypothetical protein